MTDTGTDGTPGRRSPSPGDDEVNTLIKVLTVLGVAIGLQQLISPYVGTIMAIAISIGATALFVLVGLVAIRVIRRWRDQVSLRVWVIVVCIAAAGLVGMLTGLALAYAFDGGAQSWDGHL
ncbi:hypothetical protein [Actinocrispum wychmicini]|uniref:Uncharacterized protein n=1 Tax=Actinocrispum wychmicini TaxID=1213861 RepID=A0A4R2JWX1_9PSEU|nr:hypothetical protein [Actinocrispum wychmicini]TCO64983.1 hypothetical protein EV192_101767 [Actinocrispum wychmicini]